MAVSEVGDEYTIDQVDNRGGGPDIGYERIEFVCHGVGLVKQLAANLFQSVSRPELILTVRGAS